jgi:hypothetical protein
MRVALEPRANPVQEGPANNHRRDAGALVASSSVTATG